MSSLHQLPQGRREASSKNYNKMWTNGLLIVALVVIYYTHLIRKWRNPKINVLPSGSIGWLLIGETLQFIIPGKSLDLHPFV